MHIIFSHGLIKGKNDDRDSIKVWYLFSELGIWWKPGQNTFRRSLWSIHSNDYLVGMDGSFTLRILSEFKCVFKFIRVVPRVFSSLFGGC